MAIESLAAETAAAQNDNSNTSSNGGDPRATSLALTLEQDPELEMMRRSGV